MLVSAVSAQDLLLKQKTEDVLSDDDDFGPNKKKYRHNFLGVGFAVPTVEDKEVRIHGGSSFALAYGYRIKRKLTNTFSLGYDLRLGYDQYRGKQDTSSVYTQNYGVIAPDSMKTDKLSYTSLQIAPYFRINIGTRGDHLGKYIDLSFYGELMLSSAHTVKFNHPTDEVAGESHIRTRQLKYTNKLFYGPEIRYGNAFYNVYLRYRMNNFFNRRLTNEPYQLPAIQAGLYLVIPG